MDIITRAAWGAQHADGSGPAPLPAHEWWLHHSVTLAPDLAWIDADGDQVDDDEERAMRTLETIGEQRFGQGISYTFLIMPSGRAYVGHSMGRLGAHTAGHNAVGRAICLVGNYDTHQPTGAQLDAAAQILVDEHRAARATTHRLTGGHRDLKATACPGRHAHAAIGEINRRAAALWDHTAAPATPPAPAPARPSTSSRPTLRRGARGPAVGELQRVLAAWYPALNLAVDGDFGPATERAVRHLQQRAEIVVDGIAGPATYRALRM